MKIDLVSHPARVWKKVWKLIEGTRYLTFRLIPSSAFIRCIIPGKKKASFNFFGKIVLEIQYGENEKKGNL